MAIYIQFTKDNEIDLSNKDFPIDEIENIPINDFIKYSKDWIVKFKSK